MFVNIYNCEAYFTQEAKALIRDASIVRIDFEKNLVGFVDKSKPPLELKAVGLNLVYITKTGRGVCSKLNKESYLRYICTANEYEDEVLEDGIDC